MGQNNVGIRCTNRWDPQNFMCTCAFLPKHEISLINSMQKLCPNLILQFEVTKMTCKASCTTGHASFSDEILVHFQVYASVWIRLAPHSSALSTYLLWLKCVCWIFVSKIFFYYFVIFFQFFIKYFKTITRFDWFIN